MYVFEELFSNRIMWVGVLAWFVAQAIKVLIAGVREKRLNARLLFSLGGMPSSHSAIVSALSTSIGLVNGFNSSEFAISFVVAVVVMTDAAGVRRAAGKQAMQINCIVEELIESGDFTGTGEKLKELLGHTPLEVFMGMLLGILLAFLVIY
ncbi:MAG TPA: divergent PAP2 family protein [Candidatus Alectryocaccomicrobium excrementavium]|uniref:Divergent PAP2 family protein n=1 Tax=Candidatus Alectryocaccomicrobium excrementavium TaxID=2840668 RepID=A0A9D1FYG1_9FIRM|nr:divergent PAP2 family protein [Candidatus Alectryocaccomicrobium excrementavium]